MGDLIEVKVEDPKLSERTNVLNFRDHVVGQIQAPQVAEPLQAVNFMNFILAGGVERQGGAVRGFMAYELCYLNHLNYDNYCRGYC
jgi:hypothetical protein